MNFMRLLAERLEHVGRAVVVPEECSVLEFFDIIDGFFVSSDLLYWGSPPRPYSPWTLSMPRSSNCRKPVAGLTIPNTGSTVCCRSRSRALISGCAIFLGMAAIQSARTAIG